MDHPSRNYKSQKAKEVPLPKQACEMIQALPKRNEFVFVGPGARPIGDFSKLKERLDANILAARRGLDPEAEPIPHWTFHDLRRSCATWLQEHGFAPHITDAVFGHAVEGVLKGYARGQQRELKRRALQAWADFLTGGEPRRGGAASIGAAPS